MGRYLELQEEQKRADEAASRVGRLFPARMETFRAAQNAAGGANGDKRAEAGAAFEMRTFLEKLKGDLFNLPASSRKRT